MSAEPCRCGKAGRERTIGLIDRESGVQKVFARVFCDPCWVAFGESLKELPDTYTALREAGMGHSAAIEHAVASSVGATESPS